MEMINWYIGYSLCYTNHSCSDWIQLCANEHWSSSGSKDSQRSDKAAQWTIKNGAEICKESIFADVIKDCNNIINCIASILGFVNQKEL